MGSNSSYLSFTGGGPTLAACNDMLPSGLRKLLAAAFLLSACNLGELPAPEPIEVSQFLRANGETDSADVIVRPSWLWPDGDVYALIQTEEPAWYDFWGSPALGSEATKQLHQAVEELAAHTPVRIHLITDASEAASGYYVDVMGNGDEGVGGTASVGTSYTYPTWFGLAGDLRLRSGASSMRHELGHVLGLQHTQMRTDRDAHIKIHWDQIEPGFQQWFEPIQNRHIGPYDVESIMHYGSYYFTTDEKCATITLPSASDNCAPSPEDLIVRSDYYSGWNYVVLSALYCDSDYCGDNCASEQRCNSEIVQSHRKRLRHWEAKGEKTLARGLCGDGFVDRDEECDSPTHCNSDCTRPGCGDGILDLSAGEACDDQGESSLCNLDCRLSRCGDNAVNRSAGEACDGGKETVSCNDNCTLAGCGDFVVNGARGEECDEGGQSATCESNCTRPICGDGVINVYAGEQCDGQADCSDTCQDLDTSGPVGCSSTSNTVPLHVSLLLLLALWGWRRRYYAS